MEKRDIKLHNGNTLEVEVTPVFLDKIREHLELSENEPVTDLQIKMFIYSCTNNALSKEDENPEVDS